MSFKVNQGVEVLTDAPHTHKVKDARMHLQAGELEYLVEYQHNGETHQRWFLESQLSPPSPPTGEAA